MILSTFRFGNDIQIYISLVGYYGISTLLGYSMPNPVYIYIYK